MRAREQPDRSCVNQTGQIDKLRTPSGHFAVGRVTYAWVNDALTDELSPAPTTKREVLVWIWYPSTAPSGRAAEYVPAPWRAALARSTGVLMSQFLTRDPAVVRAHSSADTGVSPEWSAYPV